MRPVGNAAFSRHPVACGDPPVLESKLQFRKSDTRAPGHYPMECVGENPGLFSGVCKAWIFLTSWLPRVLSSGPRCRASWMLLRPCSSAGELLTGTTLPSPYIGTNPHSPQKKFLAAIRRRADRSKLRELAIGMRLRWKRVRSSPTSWRRVTDVASARIFRRNQGPDLRPLHQGSSLVLVVGKTSH